VRVGLICGAGAGWVDLRGGCGQALPNSCGCRAGLNFAGRVRTKHFNPRKTLAPAPQMRVPANRAGKTAPRRTLTPTPLTSVATSDILTSDLMFLDKFLMSDVFAQNLMWTGLLFLVTVSSHFRIQIS